MMARRLILPLVIAWLVLLGSTAPAQVVQVAQPAPDATKLSSLMISGRVQLQNGSPADHARGYFSWLGTDYQVHFLPVPIDAQGRFNRERKLEPAAAQMMGAITVFAFGQPILWHELKLSKSCPSLDLEMPPGAE